jgi:glycosyltransferase involved in cell wall biosynthesis
MNIAVVTPGFSSSESAAELSFLLGLCKRLAVRHDVCVFTLYYPQRESEYFLEQIRVIPMNGNRTIIGARMKTWGRFLRRFKHENVRNRFDILHAFWLGESGFLGTLAAQLHGIPAVVSACGGEFVNMPSQHYGGMQSLRTRMLTGYAVRCAGRITVGSRYMLELMRTHYAPHMHNVMFIPFGVDVRGFQRTAEKHQNGRFNILNVGWLNPVKNQGVLLEAIALARHRIPGIHLTLVGDGAMEEELRALALRLQIDSIVSFAGNVPWTDVKTAHQSADLLVSTSLHEAQGIAVLEAAASGLPVIATPVGSAPELGDAVLLVPPDDPAILSRAIVDLYRDPTERERRGHALAEAVKEGFDTQMCADAFERCYKELADTGVRPL